MALIFRHPFLFLFAVLLLVFLAWLQYHLRLRWRPALVMRSLLVLAALTGLFFPQGEVLSEEVRDREILILDRSDSISPFIRADMEVLAREWMGGRPNRVVILAGDSAKAVSEPDQEWPRVDGRGTNLSGAVELAAEMMGNLGGKILLASDGLAQDPLQVNAAVEKLKAKGFHLDVLPLEVRSDPQDVSLAALSVPAVLWEKTPVNVVAQLQGGEDTLPGNLHWQVLVNDQEQLANPEPLGGGFYAFRLPPQNEGIAGITVRAALAGDPFPENNTAYAMVSVYRPPKILFITEQPEERFTRLLETHGLEVDTVSPEELSSSLAGLEPYQVIFVNNVLATSLTARQMDTIRSFASQRGGGVIFTGGQNGYTLGGYKNSVLEPMFPVRLEPPNRQERTPVVFLLVLDNSASMMSDSSDGNASIQPLVLAKEAAVRAIEMLDTRDWLGVLTFSMNPVWMTNLRPLGDGVALRQAMDSIGSIETDTVTNMFRGLKEGLSGLNAVPGSDGKRLHLLLLSDGKSTDGDPEAFQQLAREAKQKGIAISTIGLGAEADLNVLEDIARQAGGRFYAARDAQDLPRVMMNESRAARSENIQTGRTSLKEGEPGHPVISGLTGERLPAVNGYNAVQSRADGADGGPAAEDILVSSSFSDPILSAWQFGLGRVVAWTSDLGKTWAEPWQSEIDEGYFWTQVVRYALPNPALEEAQVSVTNSGGKTTVRAFLQDKADAPMNMLDVRFTYATASGEPRSVPLPQVKPGVYQLDLPRLAEGTYWALLDYQERGAEKVEVPAPFAISAPEEWKPVSAAQAEQGLANLNAWADASGGTVLVELPVDQAMRAARRDPRTTQWMLLLALVISWPLEIAARRRWLPWSSR